MDSVEFLGILPYCLSYMAEQETEPVVSRKLCADAKTMTSLAIEARLPVWAQDIHTRMLQLEKLMSDQNDRQQRFARDMEKQLAAHTVILLQVLEALSRWKRAEKSPQPIQPIQSIHPAHVVEHAKPVTVVASHHAPTSQPHDPIQASTHAEAQQSAQDAGYLCVEQQDDDDFWLAEAV